MNGEIARKLTSRKLWAAVIVTVTMVAGAAMGSVSGDIAAGAIASAWVAYCLSEGWVDAKSAEANGTQVLVNETTERSVTATSADKATVVAAFNAGRED